MSLELKKDRHGNFIPASEKELEKALTQRSEAPKKYNSQGSDESVLSTTLQEIEKFKDVTLEEMGL